MRIQSRYNQKNHELELYLLSEIRDIGLQKWNKKVEAERRKIEVEMVGFKHSNKKNNFLRRRCEKKKQTLLSVFLE